MRFGKHTTRCLCAASLAVVAGGCHEYVPVRAGAPVPSGVVRVTLTDEGTVALGSTLGPRASVLEGRWLARTDTSVVIGVTQVTRIDGTEQTLNGDPITVAPSSIQNVGVVRTSVTRSLLLGGAIVAAAVLAAAGIGQGSGVGGGRGGGSQQPGK